MFEPDRFVKTADISNNESSPLLSNESNAAESRLKASTRSPKAAHFIRGPIPLDWMETAIPLGRKATQVALAIWYAHGFNRDDPVIKLTRTKLKRFDVTTETARTILHKFEAAGLVSVDRKQGRSPLVTIKSIQITDKKEQ